MTRPNPNGRAQAMSMAEFNERAKHVSVTTGEVEKGSSKRSPVNRWRTGTGKSELPRSEANANREDS